jgi:hypothetical protein
VPVIGDPLKEKNDFVTPLSITAVISLMTYLVVFNLKLITSAWHGIVDKPKTILFEKMRVHTGGGMGIEKQHNDERPSEPRQGRPFWTKIVEELEVIPQQDKEQEPTKWWYLLFAVYILWIQISSIYGWVRKFIEKILTRSTKQKLRSDETRNIHNQVCLIVPARENVLIRQRTAISRLETAARLVRERRLRWRGRSLCPK